MNKIKQFIKNISPLNNRTDMPVLLYIIKVIIIFWFVKFGAELIGEGLVIALHFACGMNPLEGEIFDGKTIIVITYFGYGLMTLLAILYWKLFQKKTVCELGFTKKAGTYFIGAVAGALLIAVSVGAVMLTGTITCNGVFRNIDHIYIMLMFGAFICQGAFEEVLCRGIVHQLLMNKTSVPVTVGISAVLFIIPHLNNLNGEGAGIVFFAVADLTLVSFVFSFLTLRFRSIWAACGMHSGWNYILFNILGLNLSGNDELTAAVFDMRSAGENILNGGKYGIEASAITAIALAVFLIICYTISRKKESREGQR